MAESATLQFQIAKSSVMLSPGTEGVVRRANIPKGLVFPKDHTIVAAVVRQDLRRGPDSCRENWFLLL